jgi:hypothetical protein
LSLTAGLFLASISWAASQTLEETAAYILDGGFAELDDIKTIDQDTVVTPPHNESFVQIPKQTFKVIFR